METTLASSGSSPPILRFCQNSTVLKKGCCEQLCNLSLDNDHYRLYLRNNKTNMNENLGALEILYPSADRPIAQLARR